MKKPAGARPAGFFHAAACRAADQTGAGRRYACEPRFRMDTDAHLAIAIIWRMMAGRD